MVFVEPNHGAGNVRNVDFSRSGIISATIIQLFKSKLRNKNLWSLLNLMHNFSVILSFYFTHNVVHFFWSDIISATIIQLFKRKLNVSFKKQKSVVIVEPKT